jgi:serine/threonine protein kinase
MTAIMKAGRYEIVGELGRGAMGVVYKANDPVIGRAVAVKTIKLSAEGTGLSQTELLSRFQTEARAAGLLTHPNIVVVFDAGEEEGLYYITMELVEGKSVQALLDAGHAFPLPRVLRIMEQTCNALHFAHERNVVHRDIKPANIMLTGDDTVKVTDFGTAKILQFGTVQQTAHVMGTPSYMSPEQVKGRAVDGRSDIFSLGVMLYEMITGEKPFPGQSITTVIYKIVNEEPVPPRQINPSIHPGISAAVMKALAKEPEDRYQTCRELLEDLRNYRAIAAADSTQRSSSFPAGAGSVNATVALNTSGAAAGLRGVHAENPHSTPAGRTPGIGAGNPNQTPPLRRTAPIPVYEEPKETSIVWTVLAAVLLLGVIVFGAYKLRPVFTDARKTHDAQSTSLNEPAAPANSSAGEAPASGEPKSDPGAAPANAAAQGAPAQPDTAESVVAQPPTPNVEGSKLADQQVAGQASTSESKPDDGTAKKAAPKKSEAPLTAKAEQFKEHVEAAIAERGLAGRAKVQGVGNTLVLAGKLRPSEHGALLKLLRDAPVDVRVVDHIEYDDAPATAAENASEGTHPVPNAGRGAIHMVTDVIGVTAVLHGPLGRALNQCQTPCSFNNLIPAKYSVDLQRDGYKPVQTSLQVKANEVSDQKLSLEPIGASAVPQPQLAANSRVAWAQVVTTPAGADVLVDGNPTGQSSPSRIELPIGVHTITLRMNGYKDMRRTVEVSDGGTVTVAAVLRHQ